MEVQPYLFVFDSARFGALFQFLGPSGYFLFFGAIFGVEVGSNTFLEPTNIDYQLFVLEVQPYLFVFNSAKFWAFLEFFGPFGAIFGVGVRFKNFFGTCLHRLTTFILEV